MRKHKVVFSPRGEADILGLYDWIADDAGEQTAGAYIARIEAACMALESFPQRGTRRDDIRRGVRTMGFERRMTIVFRVAKREVVILRIFYGGQDFERALRRSPDG